MSVHLKECTAIIQRATTRRRPSSKTEPRRKRTGVGMELDDNMVIADDNPEWRNNDWWYNIVGKANPTDEKFLKLYSKKKEQGGKTSERSLPDLRC